MVTVDNEILFYAFRYSLGRMSFASRKVQDNILENLHNLKAKDIKQIIKEIEQAPSLGLDYEKLEWIKFKKKLEKYLLDEILY